MTANTKRAATSVMALVLALQLAACQNGCAATKGFLPPAPTSVKGGIDLAKGMAGVVADTAAELRELNQQNPELGINQEMGKQIETYLIDARATLQTAQDFERNGDLTNASLTLTKAQDLLNLVRTLLNSHGGRT